MPTRREKIEAMLADNPADTFLRDSLCWSARRKGIMRRSLAGLAGLTRDQPPYVPAFFMAAQQLVKLSRIEEARTFLRDGIEAARGQGNAHAAGEMAEFLTSLGALG